MTMVSVPPGGHRKHGHSNDLRIRPETSQSMGVSGFKTFPLLRCQVHPAAHTVVSSRCSDREWRSPPPLQNPGYRSCLGLSIRPAQELDDFSSLELRVRWCACRVRSPGAGNRRWSRSPAADRVPGQSEVDLLKDDVDGDSRGHNLPVPLDGHSRRLHWDPRSRS